MKPGLLWFGAASDFPSFDILHAHCMMTVEVSGTCSEVYSTIKNTIATMADPLHGHYKLFEDETDQYVWAVRTEPTFGWKYDVIWEMVSSQNESCTV